MSDSEKRRFGGGRVVLAFLALLGATIGLALYFFDRGKDPRGEILALHAEGPGSALLLRRATGRQSYVHLVRFAEDGSQPHKISLFGIQEGAAPRVFGEIVLVEAMTARGYPTVQAFAAKDLAFAYWGPEPSKTLEDGARGATRLASRGGQPVWVSVHAGRPGELLVADASSGEELVRKPLDDVAEPARLTLLDGDAVRVATKGGSLDLALADGEAREGASPLPADEACAAGLPFDGGCLLQRGAEFVVITEAGRRAFEIRDASRLGPVRGEHLSGSSLFLVVDGDEVVILDLERLDFRSPSLGLELRTLPSESTESAERGA